MALKMVPNCEQLIDPVVNVQAFMVLKAMERGVNMHAGIKQCRRQLLDHKPLALIVPTDLSPRDATAKHVNELKSLAMLAQVPVVHAMTPTWLARAVGYDRSPVHAVVIMSVPNDRVSELMTSMMHKVADAYRAWIALNATAKMLTNDPRIDTMSLVAALQRVM